MKTDTGTILTGTMEPEPRPGPAYTRKSTIKIFDLNNCLWSLKRFISPESQGQISLRTAFGEMELPVRGDPAGIATLFFALLECGTRLVPGGSMTVLTMFLPLYAHWTSESRRKGCALLSFQAAPRSGQRIANFSGQEEIVRVLSDVRTMVEEMGGRFRLSFRSSGISFNIYLPLMWPIHKIVNT